MHDTGKILIGIVVFLGLFSSPVWIDLIAGSSNQKPKIILPDKNETPECVMSAEYMKHNHMNLLNEWRDEVVRNGKRDFITKDGKKFDMSLTGTCLSCHSDKSQFCDQCHGYLGVEPYCWDCHVDPKMLEKK